MSDHHVFVGWELFEWIPWSPESWVQGCGKYVSFGKLNYICTVSVMQRTSARIGVGVRTKLGNVESVYRTTSRRWVQGCGEYVSFGKRNYICTVSVIQWASARIGVGVRTNMATQKVFTAQCHAVEMKPCWQVDTPRGPRITTQFPAAENIDVILLDACATGPGEITWSNLSYSMVNGTIFNVHKRVNNTSNAAE